jgi:cellobiose transport system permease protein
MANRTTRAQLAAHAVLGVGVLISMFPFYWSIVLATNTSRDVFRYPPRLLPGTHLVENVRHVLDTVDFFGSMLNTLVVAICTTVLVLFFDSLAAFTFAKYRFPGRNVLFGLLMVIFMLPAQLSIIPQYLIMVKIGWVGTLQALVVPAAVNAFGIFWMRQYITRALPDEILDAARMDGAGFLRTYTSVCLPMIRPGLAFLGIYTFINAWNDYIWPLVVLTNPDKVTLQVVLAQLNLGNGGVKTDYAMLMAGTLMAVTPLLIVFVLFARNFVADLAKGAVQG